MDAQALAQTQQKHTRIATRSLKDVVVENRAKHEREYQEAIRGWRVQYARKAASLVDELQTSIAVLKDDDVDHITTEFATSLYLPTKPESYLADYDRVLKRLELTLDEEWWLSNEEFERYVLDNWKWKPHHQATHAAYSSLG